MVSAAKYTTKTLKEMLASMGLPTSGNKNEFLMRLNQAEGFDMRSLERTMESPEQDDDDVHEKDASGQKVIEIFRREKELAERELALVRRELEMVRNRWVNGEMRDAERVVDEPVTLTETVPRSSVHMRVTKVVDLLSPFSGNANAYEIWEKQVTFLKEMYRLEEDAMKILIGMRLKGKALE